MKVSFLKEYVLTLGTALAVSGFSFVLYKLMLITYSQVGLDYFAVIRRYQAALVPLLMLGYGVMLPKAIAAKKIDSGTVNFALLTSVSCFILLSFFSYLTDERYFYALLFSGPIVITGFIYCIYRGLQDFKLGAVSNVCFLIVLPLISFFATSSLKFFIVIYFLLSAFSFVWWYFLISPSRIVFPGNKATIGNKLFFIMSLARVPGDFFNQFIFVLPVVFVDGTKYSSGELSLAIAVMIAFAIPLRPISTILLVKISAGGGNKREFVRSLMIYIVLSVVVSIGFYFCCDVFNYFYYNNDSFGDVLKSLTFAVLLNSLYVLLRSYADAKFDKPVLSYINAVGLLILTLLLVSGVDVVMSLIFSLSVNMLLLGGLLLSRNLSWTD
ncbi:hypothetical protein [Pseudomonas sp. R3-41]